MVINNEANRKKLAEAVVDAFDMEALIDCATEFLMSTYKNNEAVFHEDWEATFEL